ncbi:MAG: hypothetical protein IJ786_00955 [Bacteroidaceae bacterium]|nr:hypothetical protein [Bacteroidaceae bacterium]
MKVRIGETLWEVTLANNATAQAFAERLPFALTMQELNGNEKYAYVSSPLPEDASCPDFIHAGDLMLFQNNCIVLFYASFHTTYPYTRIGHLEQPESLAECLASRGDVSVAFFA